MGMNYKITSKYGNICVVKRGDYSFGVFDLSGKEIVPFGKYGWIDGFDTHGLARVRTEKILDVAQRMNTSVDEIEWMIGTVLNGQDTLEQMKHPKWGIIDTNGNEVLPLEYDCIWKFLGTGRETTNILKDGKRYRFSLKSKSIISKEYRRNNDNYEDDYDYKRDTWDAMTDGMYGDMPDGFDGDYSCLGF